MYLKSILAVCALALVGVNADARTDAHRNCIKKNGIFLEARDDPSDTRYGCLTSMRDGDGWSKYCVNYDGSDLCYEPSLGNINYCVYNHREYNGRGCALSLSALWSSIKNDDKKYESTKKACPRKKGYFLENNHDLTDKRFACLTPNNGNTRNKYCVTYDDIAMCYEPNLGNISYCDSNNKNYHGRGCAMGLSYLWNVKKDDDQKRELSRATCIKRSGWYLENTSDKTDTRFACLQDYSRAENRDYCVTYDDNHICYTNRLSNIDYCEKNHPDFNSRGCALGLSYLWQFKRR